MQRIFDAAWPFIRGHPTEFAVVVHISHGEVLKNACQVERTRITTWRNQRTAMGLDQDDEAPVAKFYAEMERGEDGGVSLMGRNDQASMK